MNLADWLIAQIAADEEVARAATPGRWKLWGMSVMADQDGTSNVDTAVYVARTAMLIDGKPRTFDATHIARWDPARVLAECAAKRALIALGEKDSYWDDVLAALAQPYRDREGYQTEWDVQ